MNMQYYLRVMFVLQHVLSVVNYSAKLQQAFPNAKQIWSVHLHNQHNAVKQHAHMHHLSVHGLEV